MSLHAHSQKDNDAELVKRARDGMTGEEAQFSVEVPIEAQALIWSDKYRPRKPRFFNRVHTVSFAMGVNVLAFSYCLCSMDQGLKIKASYLF
jgi:hypothetical protein